MVKWNPTIQVKVKPLKFLKTVKVIKKEDFMQNKSNQEQLTI